LFKEKLNFRDEVQYVTTLPETIMLEINVLKTTVNVAIQERPKAYYAYGEFPRDLLSSL
jgi:hypothetical protein